MTNEELNHKMLTLVKSEGFPTFEPNKDAGTIADVLLNELEQNWDVLPTDTRAVMLAVATSLKKYYADNLLADMVSDQTLNKMRGGF